MERAWKKLVVVLLVAIAFEVSCAQRLTACEDIRQEEKCEPTCIPPVRGTVVYWRNRQATSFLVNWDRVPSAKCYHIKLLNGYTIRVLKTIKCHNRASYNFTNLTPNRVYGVEVSAVNFRCMKGNPGQPARTRTRWAPVPTTTTPAPPPRPTPRQGACGAGKFTCQSDPDACIPNEEWCNGRLNCQDSSDERNCPGGCKELGEKFPNGNFTCTRWGSPGSFCWFDCLSNYAIEGRKYTICSRTKGTWSYPVPVCKLKKSKSITIDDIGVNSIVVTLEPVEAALSYTVEAEPSEGGMKKNTTAKCCTGAIEDLDPDTEYKITVLAVDESGQPGAKSPDVFATTSDE